ncbi:MAG: hypothetical protein E7A63_18995 [Clostridium butyricum]|nr:hypothetical protein [Clostridium butyricum]MDU1007122.1 hypothetical protein [Clostridium butyricum]
MIKYYKVSIIFFSLICLIGCDNIKFEKYDDISYEDADQAGNPPAYATGIYMKGNKLLSIEYGLYNDVENEKNIEDVYSIFFKTILENPNCQGVKL